MEQQGQLIRVEDIPVQRQVGNPTTGKGEIAICSLSGHSGIQMKEDGKMKGIKM